MRSPFFRALLHTELTKIFKRLIFTELIIYMLIISGSLIIINRKKIWRCLRCCNSTTRDQTQLKRWPLTQPPPKPPFRAIAAPTRARPLTTKTTTTNAWRRTATVPSKSPTWRLRLASFLLPFLPPFLPLPPREGRASACRAFRTTLLFRARSRRRRSSPATRAPRSTTTPPTRTPRPPSLKICSSSCGTKPRASRTH